MKAFIQRWWKADVAHVHEAVFAMAKDLEMDQATRRMDNGILRQLYGAKGYRTNAHADVAPNLSPMYATDGVWRYNLIRTAVDVLQSKVGRGKPKASFVTTGGTWAQQRRARRLDKYVYGCMHGADFYRSARLVFRDAAVTDLGVVKGWVEGGRVRLTRVDPDEIKVSAADAYYGKPRTLLHSYVVSRDEAHGWVEAWHADKSQDERDAMHRAVDKAAVAPDKNRSLRRTATFGDVVQVEEAWHLPNGPGGDANCEACDGERVVKEGKSERKCEACAGWYGRHVLSLSTVTLVDEDCSFFPFATCRVFEPFVGFYGQGIGELLVPHQRAINMTLRRVSLIIKQMSTARLYVDASSKVQMEHLATNEPALIIRGGKPAQSIASNNVPPELWRYVDYAIARGLEQVGINEQMTAARKPSGVQSGAAVREVEDIQSERHAPIHLAFEDFILDAARLVVRLSARAAEEGERLTAFFPKGRRSEPINWTDVEADEDTFTLQVHSTSSLPTTPAARKQYVEELWASGQVDSAEYRRLLDMPDTEASDDLALAARDVVDASLEKMLDGDDDEGAEDDYTAPEPFDDLAYAVKRGTIVYARARLEGAPESRLELVRRYILQAQGLLAKAQAAGGAGDMRRPDAAQPGPAPAAMQ